MLDFVAFLVAVGPVSIGVTKAVDFVRSFDKDDSWPKGLWIALAMVFGVVLALLSGANFVNLIEGLRPEVTSRLDGTLGEILTGIAIGGVASFWHEHMDKTSAQAKEAQASAPLSGQN